MILNNIVEIQKIKIINNNKSLSMFHVNACSLSRNFDDCKHLLKCTNGMFDIISVFQPKVTKVVPQLCNINVNNYSIELTPIEGLFIWRSAGPIS